MVDDATVRALVADRFPACSRLPVVELATGGGSDHHLFRVGERLLARFPRRADAADQIALESRWLPVLAPGLPVDVPVPLGRGAPGHGYPWPWSLLPWLPGEAATAATSLGDDATAALAGVVRALGLLDTAGGPAGRSRGVPLADRDAEVREALTLLRKAPWCRLDLAVAERVWAEALEAAPYAGPPRWLHGDLLPGNILLDATGRLCAVIDFGCLGLGDPACDLMAAWTIVTARRRERFRRLAGDVAADDAAWRRGRGWALSFGLIALPYHRERTPALAAVAERAVHEATRD